HRIHALLRTLGPRVVPQARIGPFTVDVLLPDLAVVVESDSRRYHTLSEDAGDDRRRDRALQELGLLVVHVWSDDLMVRGGATKIMDHIRLRIWRGREVRLGGYGSRGQFLRFDRRVAKPAARDGFSAPHANAATAPPGTQG
ncbi:MAG TPA: DUF559 domain-containing protein, partial [Thermoplasmata archaeon]|nr:DUF559 domain-containing protein [Thermoplasmata archaeon]